MTGSTRSFMWVVESYAKSRTRGCGGMEYLLWGVVGNPDAFYRLSRVGRQTRKLENDISHATPPNSPR